MRLLVGTLNILSLFLVAVAENSFNEVAKEASRHLETVSCRLVTGGFLSADPQQRYDVNDEMQWRCVFQEEGDVDVVKELEGIPDGFFEKYEDQIKSGVTILTFTYDQGARDLEEGYEEESSVFAVPPGANVEISQLVQGQYRGDVVPIVGTKSVLVVRVTDRAGDAPDLTAAELSNEIFGTGTRRDKYNLQSQYMACSGGKLNFVPATGYNIVNGVVELKIPNKVKTETFFTVERWVSQKLPEVLGRNPSNWDHVMYVFPESVDKTYAGYAYYNWYLSLYHNLHVRELLVQMHEIGHNLNHYHSGEGPQSYGDGTCMMGAHIWSDDSPKMCFNGAKSWYFGWYKEANIEIDPSTSSWHGKLVGIDDFLNKRINDSDQHVVVKIEAKKSSPLFLLFNRKKGVNSEVYEKGDMVTVVGQKLPTSQSLLYAGLTENTKPYRVIKWSAGQDDLVIEVCERKFGTPDYARVLVFIDNDENRLSCASTPTPLPTSSPTQSPTSSPTESGTEIDVDLPGAGEVDDNANAPPKETLESVTLRVSSGQGDYRERRKGDMSFDSEHHDLFSAPSWYSQAYFFTPDSTKSIPPGAVIASAVMLIYPSDVTREIQDQIFGHAIGHATGKPRGYQKEDFSITNSPKTLASATIDPNLPEWKQGHYQPLVNATSIVQEIVNRGDYSEGNAIEIFLIGDDSSTFRRIKTYETGGGAMLEVKYKVMLAADAGGPYEAFEGTEIEVDGSRSSGQIKTYTWSFGDGEKVTSQSPTARHVYSKPGSYTIQLTITTPTGAQGQDTTIATIQAGNIRDEPDTEGRVEVEMQVSGPKDDYREMASGKASGGKPKHKLMTSKFERLAYRFRDSPIPRRATILEARLEMMPKGSNRLGREVSCIVQGHNVGNSKSFRRGEDSENQLLRARKTKASVAFTNLPEWKADEYNSLGDVAPIIQEIVNREDYSEGNAIKLILSNNGSPDYRQVRTFESGAGAKLIVAYRK